MFNRYWWMFLAMVPVGALVGLLVAGIVTYLTPTEYESTAMLELVDRRPRAMDAEMREPRRPQFFQTEIKKITSQKPLKMAMYALDLNNRWGLDHEQTLTLMKKAMKPRHVAGTDLISITVRHTSREDARDIAVEVTRAYIQYRDKLAEKPLEEMAAALEDVLRNQEDIVAENASSAESVGRNWL